MEIVKFLTFYILLVSDKLQQRVSVLHESLVFFIVLIFDELHGHQFDPWHKQGSQIVSPVEQFSACSWSVQLDEHWWFIMFVFAVMCGTPPAVDNAYLVGRRRSHYDIHAVVRYQCADGFFQRHIPTVRCHPNGTWERPKIICTKCESQHGYLNQYYKK